MNAEQRLELERDRAEIREEIEAIRARPDLLLEMPVIDPQRREEYKRAGERGIARLERLLEKLS